MAVQGAAGDVLGLRVADLELWLDARGSCIPLAKPVCHAPFFAVGDPGSGLILRVRNGPFHSTIGWQSVFYDTEHWQLWRDGSGRDLFVASRKSPPRREVVVDAAYSEGEVVGEFEASLAAGEGIYPLHDLDMVLYANWLARYGDVMVHAAGVAAGGAGYAFVGPAGAGKSTLAAELARDPSVTVLGEDQVIIRCIQDRYLLYGTPWHTNPSRCSPGGAPLEKLFFLDRSRPPGLEPCGRIAGVECLLQQAFVPYYNRPGVERILSTLARLAEHVRFYTLSARLGDDSLDLVGGA